MTKDFLKLHAKSAALTFASVFGVEMYAATSHAVYFSDIVWAPVLSAATLTAVRAVLKLSITSLGGKDK